MLKQIGRNFAQVTLVNLIAILVILILWFVFLPVIINFTNNSAIPAIAGCPSTLVPVCPNGATSITGSTADQPTKDIEMALIQLFPVVVTIMIIISALNYAIPRREGY